MEAVSQKCLHEDVGKIYIFSLSPPITGIMLLNENIRQDHLINETLAVSGQLFEKIK